MKRSKVWLGVGVFVMAGSQIAGPALATEPATQGALPDASSLMASTAPALRFAQAAQPQSAKPAPAPAEGGEGGEGKIDPGAVEADPIDYGIALEVIAAHYHAGLKAYESGQQEAGAQMFAHGLTEVYGELEDVFKKRGVTDLGGKLNAALAAGTDRKPVKEVRRKVDAVLASLAKAEKAAPKSDKPAQAIKVEVMAEMLERCAAQYRVAAKSTDFETYLDGLGFSLSARAAAGQALPWLKKTSPAKAAALEKVLAMAAKAYPGIKRPGTPAVDADKFLAAASEARVAVAQLP